MVSVRSGSKMTMSASEPTAMVPFFGNSPKVLAAAVEVSSTKRFSVRRPSTTPAWKMRLMRFSTPGAPLGILVKLSRPSSFCSLKQKGQWSVAMVARWPKRRPSQRTSWFHFSRSAGVITHLAPSKLGRS
jgi:hypothetical protein